MMSMRKRILEGKLFTDYCEGLPQDRLQAKKRMTEFNRTEPDDVEKRMSLITEIFGKETKAWIEPPIYFCYGTNIQIGDGSYINFNCNFVDDTKIILGKKVFLAPGVTIATTGHPIHPDYRNYMYCNPVIIGDNVWIGSGAIICPGVEIGENTVIGAGSVVTKNIPTNSVAVGNPCKVLRPINEDDYKYYYRGRPFTQEDLDEEASLRKG